MDVPVSAPYNADRVSQWSRWKMINTTYVWSFSFLIELFWKILLITRKTTEDWIGTSELDDDQWRWSHWVLSDRSRPQISAQILISQRVKFTTRWWRIRWTTDGSYANDSPMPPSMEIVDMYVRLINGSNRGSALPRHMWSLDTLVKKCWLFFADIELAVLNHLFFHLSVINERSSSALFYFDSTTVPVKRIPLLWW